MFEWLEQEILEVKTPRFYSITGPPDSKLRAAITGSNMPLPTSYKEFILKFGNARLYRNSRNNSYRIGVFAGPRKAILEDGTVIYHIGFHEGASVYVKPESKLTEHPIYEFEKDLEEKVAGSFEEWLSASCARARTAYGRAQWAEILHGPNPFTPAEEEILTARQLMRWKLLGIDADGSHIFEVTNRANRTLPALTVGVRSRNGRLNGAIRLEISHIGPGQTDVLHANCYKGLAAPEQIEVFVLPDPKPEDRDFYWELRAS